MGAPRYEIAINFLSSCCYSISKSRQDGSISRDKDRLDGDSDRKRDPDREKEVERSRERTRDRVSGDKR